MVDKALTGPRLVDSGAPGSPESEYLVLSTAERLEMLPISATNRAWTLPGPLWQVYGRSNRTTTHVQLVPDLDAAREPFL